jgi:hypothetical protein
LILSSVGWLIFNFTFTFFAENLIKYGLTVGTVDKITKLNPADANSFVYKNAFIIFNFCYNFGKTITLSSLGCVKIEKVWIISAIVGVLWAFYFANYFYLWVQDIIVLWGLMVFVGISTGLN